MVYLALAILSSMLVSVTMRLSERYIKNNVSMLAVNYLMCTLLSAAFAGGSLMPVGEGAGFTVGLGLFSGALYLGSFLLLQWNIGKNGVVLPATFMKLGVLVPTAMALTVFGETPTAMQLLGAAMAVAAILLIQLERGQQRAKSRAGLVILLLAGGSTDATSKVFEAWGNAQHADSFLLITFAAALVLCALLCAVKGQRLAIKDALFGLLIGVPNYFSARFLLLSLSSVPAVIAYPTYSVATIVLITLCGVFFFKERLSARQKAALAVILAAIALLNL